MSIAFQQNKKKYELVIGIDFGTSRSGFAYGWMKLQTETQREIKLHTKWPGQPTEFEYVKTPTLLLYSPTQIIEWGHEARTTLRNSSDKDSSKDYHLFETFKMKLYGKEKEKYYESNAEKFLVLDLIADYLRQLKDYALKRILGDKLKNTVSEEKILWCLTIPAMWENDSKDTMLEAALKAGLIKNRSDYGERLVFVLEPEAAAIYCQHQDVVTDVPALKIGTRFMVVDAGGGTVDITVHEVAADGLKAVAKSIGDAHGSTYVDRDFHQHLEKLLTPEVLRQLEKNNPQAYDDLKIQWEQKKCSLSEDQIRRKQSSQIPIPRAIAKHWDERILDNLSQQQNGDEDNIVLSVPIIESIFKGTLDRLISTVDEEFADLDKKGKKCDYIFLVGGFAQSPLLQKRIRERYEGTRVERVVIPDNPSAAVLWGAVSYGIDPSVIRSRSSSLTYGVGVRMLFEDEDSKQKKEKVLDKWDNKYYCEDRFDIFVKAGQIVEVGEKKEAIYIPANPEQIQMWIKIYSTRRDNVRYVNDSDISPECEILVSMPDISGGIDREVKVTMDFSEALISATAQDLTSGNNYSIEIRFSHTYF